jgi:hypothetical protein
VKKVTSNALWVQKLTGNHPNSLLWALMVNP